MLPPITPLSDLTTLRTGGMPNSLVRVTTQEDALEFIRDTPHASVLGGGSNTLAADQLGELDVLHLTGSSIKHEVVSDEVKLHVWAGTPLKDLCSAALAAGAAGLSPMTGIPGSVGGGVVQNVGAYGAEIATSVASVTVLDRRDLRLRTLAAEDCVFRYRDSLFKRSNRFLLLHAVLRAPVQSTVAVAYSDVASALGVSMGTLVPGEDLARAVVEVRSRKGMVVAEHDTDTHSAGSFFTNPVVPLRIAEHVKRLSFEQDGRDLPIYPLSSLTAKISAAALIEMAGFSRGHALGRAKLSTKHVLAICNAGGATSAEIAALADEVSGAVAARFGIVLEREPVSLGEFNGVS